MGLYDTHLLRAPCAICPVGPARRAAGPTGSPCVTCVPMSLRAPRGAQPAGPGAAAAAAGAAAISDWAATRAKEYELIAQRRDADGPMVDRALEIVRKFIIERGLILFGGLAIDYALRLKGDQIYPDDQRPDFDFLSMRNVDDAYDLADILQKAGFEGVGAIRGIHVQTMKVRTDYVWVADIGYAPPEVFAQIPTFDYQGMRAVHPDYQRMDMHLAFCFPFNGPPREDVFHRWRKDLVRLNLFERHYPITANGAAGGAAAPPLVTGRLAVPVTGRAVDLRVALHGFAAYSAIRAALDELAAALGRPVAITAPHLALSFPDNHTIAVESPAGDAVVVASPWPAEVAPRGTRFAPYMDLYPESFHGDGAVVLSAKNRRLAATLLRAAGPDGDAQVFVVTPHYLLLWLLYEAHRVEGDAAPERRDTYRAFYLHTLEVLRAAEDIYADTLEAADDPAARAAVMALFAASPFAPTVSTIGDRNLSASYIINIASNAQTLRDTPPAVLGLDADVADLLTGLPMNYYPAKAKPRPPFAYDANPMFSERAGLRVDTDHR